MVAGATEGRDDGTGRIQNVGIPGLTVHLPPHPGTNRLALIIAPGGGYHHLAIFGANNDAVTQFNPKNVVVIILKYRTAGPYKPGEVAAHALEDGHRAVQLVRFHAREWGIDPRKIGMVGWSAGANLALNLASHFENASPDATDPVERLSSRPDFVALMVPWPFNQKISAYPISQNAPPAFMASALDDKTAPTSFARDIATSYEQAKVPASLWVIEKGGHGAFDSKARGEGAAWSARLWDWIQAQPQFQSAAPD